MNISFRVPSGLRFDHELEMVLPDGIDENENTKAAGTSSKHVRMYSGYCLRPYPAARSNYAVDYSRKTNVRLRKEGKYFDFLFKCLLQCSCFTKIFQVNGSISFCFFN